MLGSPFLVIGGSFRHRKLIDIRYLRHRRRRRRRRRLNAGDELNDVK